MLSKMLPLNPNEHLCPCNSCGRAKTDAVVVIAPHLKYFKDNKNNHLFPDQLKHTIESSLFENMLVSI